MVDISETIRILAENELLKEYVNSVTSAVNKCSNDTPLEMRLAKGHLDLIYYSQKLINRDDYNTINDLLGEEAVRFKECKCQK